MPFKTEIITKRQLKQEPESLCKKTHFTKNQVAALLQKFYIINGGKTKMEESIFMHTIFTEFDLTHALILERIFRVFDQDNDSAVSFKEWVCGMSVFLKGTKEEKIKFCFGIFNIKNDQHITRDDVMQWLKSAIPRSNDEDPDEGVRDLGDIFMKMLDKDQDGRISFLDFERTACTDEILMEGLGTCFPQQHKVDKFLEEIQNLDEKDSA